MTIRMSNMEWKKKKAIQDYLDGIIKNEQAQLMHKSKTRCKKVGLVFV